MSSASPQERIQDELNALVEALEDTLLPEDQVMDEDAYEALEQAALQLLTTSEAEAKSSVATIILDGSLFQVAEKLYNATPEEEWEAFPMEYVTGLQQIATIRKKQEEEQALVAALEDKDEQEQEQDRDMDYAYDDDEDDSSSVLPPPPGQQDDDDEDLSLQDEEGDDVLATTLDAVLDDNDQDMATYASSSSSSSSGEEEASTLKSVEREQGQGDDAVVQPERKILPSLSNDTDDDIYMEEEGQVPKEAEQEEPRDQSAAIWNQLDSNTLEESEASASLPRAPSMMMVSEEEAEDEESVKKGRPQAQAAETSRDDDMLEAKGASMEEQNQEEAIAATDGKVLAVSKDMEQEEEASSIKTFDEDAISQITNEDEDEDDASTTMHSTAIMPTTPTSPKVEQLVKFFDKDKPATLLQKLVRGYLQRSRYQQQRAAATRITRWWVLQSYRKKKDQQQQHQAEVAAATVLQARVRTHKAQTSFQQQRSASIVVQRAYRHYRHQNQKQAPALTIQKDSSNMNSEQIYSDLVGLVQSTKSRVKELGLEMEEPESVAPGISKDGKYIVTEIQGMFDYLLQVIQKLQVETVSLQAKAAAEEEPKDAVGDEDVASTSTAEFKSQIQELASVNQSLLQQVLKYRQDVAQLETSYRNKNLQLATQLEATQEQLQKLQVEHDEQVSSLQGMLKQAQRSTSDEDETLQHQLHLTKTKYTQKITKLKKELKQVRATHFAYLQKLSGVLEDTAAARTKELQKAQESKLQAVAAKDARIHELELELKQLKEKRATQAAQQEEPVMEARSASKLLSSNKRFVRASSTSAQEQLARARRSAQFQDTLQSLNKELESSSKVSNRTSDMIGDYLDILSLLYQTEVQESSSS